VTTLGKLLKIMRKRNLKKSLQVERRGKRRKLMESQRSPVNVPMEMG
jgi:hypothetical protein